MVQQVVNFAENVSQLLQDTWSLEDLLEKKKFKWFSWVSDDKSNKNEALVIEVTDIAADGVPQSLHHTKMAELVKLDLWMAVRNPIGDDERLAIENNRKLVVDEILKIIHDNQTAISGFRIATFGTIRNPDERNDRGLLTYLHTVINIKGEWFHTKS